MGKLRPSNSGIVLLNLAAYLTLILVGVEVVQALGNGRLQAMAIVLLLLFGLLLTLIWRFESQPIVVHLYFMVQTAVIILIFLLDPQHTPGINALFFVLSAYTMLFLPIRSGILWVILFFLVTIWGAVTADGWQAFLDLVTSSGAYLFFASFGAALRQADIARQQSHQLLSQLQVAHEQLKDYTLQAQQLAVAEERSRLAREMHDALGHRLTVAVVQLEGAQRLIPSQPERAAQMVKTMREQIREALQELRQAVAQLRTPLEEDLPLPTAVRHLSQSFQEATGLTIHLDIAPDFPELSGPQWLALYRTAQEGLTNIQRHANATQAWLTLSNTPETITLTVADNGAGFRAAKDNGRYGLQGLHERASLLGGQLQVENRPAGGTQLQLQIPWPSHQPL